VSRFWICAARFHGFVCKAATNVATFVEAAFIVRLTALQRSANFPALNVAHMTEALSFGWVFGAFGSLIGI
jgi:hypothetical protein